MADLLDKALEICKKNCNSQPFTTLDILKDSLLQSPLDEFVREPASLKKLLPALQTDEDATAFLQRVPAGKCTTNALLEADTLHKKYPDEFEFVFFDLGGHRVALCLKTMIILDTTSKYGAVILTKGKDGMWSGSERTKAPPWKIMRWDWDGKQLTVNNRQGKENNNSPILSRAEALTQCLLELADKPEGLCLFRSYEKETGNTSHGVLKWKFKKEEVSLSLDIKSSKREHECAILWGRKIEEGDEENEKEEETSVRDNDECWEKLLDFVEEHGGKHLNIQWTSARKAFVQALWTAATQVHGCPRLVFRQDSLGTRDRNIRNRKGI